MSVIEDALRRAEQQARAKRPAISVRPSPRPARPRPAPTVAVDQPVVSKAPRQRLGLPLLVLLFAVAMFARLIYQQSPVDGMEIRPPLSEPFATGHSIATNPVESVNVSPANGSDNLHRISPITIDQPDFAGDVIPPVAVNAVPPSRSNAAPRERFDSVPQDSVVPRNPGVNKPQAAALLQHPDINDRFHVSGVMVGGGVRMVFINNTMLGIGDRIGGAIVRAINARGATLELNGRLYDVQISSKPGATNKP